MLMKMIVIQLELTMSRVKNDTTTSVTYIDGDSNRISKRDIAIHIFRSSWATDIIA